MSGSYCCRCVTRKLSRKLLPLPVAPSTSVWPTSSTCRLYAVRRLRRRLEHRQRRRVPDVGSIGSPAVEREQEAQVRQVRLEQRQPAQVVGAVAGNDAEPGVQQVVALLEGAAVVGGEHLHGLGRGGLQGAPVRAVQDQRERAAPKKWPFTSISVSASPSCRTVAPAESSTSISSGRVSDDT